MARKKIIAAAAAAAIAFSTATVNAGSPVVTNHHGGSSSPWVAWTVIACAGLIVTAAFIANWRENRPLTAGEAVPCALPFWFNPNR